MSSNTLDFYKRTSPLDRGFYTSNYNDIRRSRAILLTCCLLTCKIFKKLSMTDQNRIVRKIERSCYNRTCKFAEGSGIPTNWENQDFINYYNILTNKLQYNIEVDENDEKSSLLTTRICNNEIDIDLIAYMSSRELQPHKSEEIYDIINTRKQQRIETKTSTQHQCFKCGNWKTTEQEYQIRSLDEGSTILVQCESEGCSNKWSISS
jgi:DNA-directed RNA polymerase subunit M/transcription elongation factor TFIIS